jgi:hypothetical protein
LPLTLPLAENFVNRAWVYSLVARMAAPMVEEKAGMIMAVAAAVDY